MEALKHALFLFFHGVKDSVCGIFLFSHVLLFKESENTVRVRQQSLTFTNADRSTIHVQRSDRSLFTILLHCVVFAALIWCSRFIFNNFVLGVLLEHYAVYKDVHLSSFELWKKFLYFIFFLFWLFPLYVLSYILTFSWYSDIADLTQKKIGVRSKSQIPTSKYYADQLESIVLQSLYTVQSSIIFILPLPAFIQTIWYLFHVSLQNSLLAFEYKWFFIGWPRHRRLGTIDRNWPYFLGFGLPLALPAAIFDFVNYRIISMTLFPLIVISSTVTHDHQSPVFILPIRSFKIVEYLAGKCVSFLFCIPSYISPIYQFFTNLFYFVRRLLGFTAN